MISPLLQPEATAVSAAFLSLAPCLLFSLLTPSFPHLSAALYYATYAHVASRPLVAELTIEDPAEAFEDLRDVCDLRMLERAVRLAGTGANGWPSRLDGKTVADRAWIEAKRKELKIASVSSVLPSSPRQKAHVEQLRWM